MSVFLEALENIGIFEWIGDAFSYLYKLYFETALTMHTTINAVNPKK